MKKSTRVALCITGSVVLAACGKPAPPQTGASDWGDGTSGESPSPSPTATPTRYAWYHPYFFLGGWGGGSRSGITDDSRGSSSRQPARGGFGSRGSGGS